MSRLGEPSPIGPSVTIISCTKEELHGLRSYAGKMQALLRQLSENGTLVIDTNKVYRLQYEATKLIAEQERDCLIQKPTKENPRA